MTLDDLAQQVYTLKVENERLRSQLGEGGNPVPETNVVPLMGDAIKTYIERSKVYGAGGFEEHGKILEAMFPEGITLKGAEQLSRFVLFILQTVKICRYAKHITKGGHKDSVHDNGVYSFILEDFDARSNNRK